MKKSLTLTLCAILTLAVVPSSATLKLADRTHFGRSEWTPFPCPTMKQRRRLSHHQNFTITDQCKDKKESKDEKDDEAKNEPNRPEPEPKPEPEPEPKPKPDPRPVPAEKPTTTVKDKPEPKSEPRTPTLGMKLSTIDGARVEDKGSYFHVTMPGQTTFATGRARLQSETKKSLRKLARAVRDGDATIIVRGHADHRPIVSPSIKERYPNNTILSRARATSAKGELAAYGIANERIVVRPMGASDPAYSSDHDNFLELNRRVDFHVEKTNQPE